MNERIKDLISEATGYTIRVYENNGVRTYGEREEFFNKEKFAELIVRECRKVIADDIDDNSDDDFDLGLDHARQIIGEHFGVEE